VDHFLEKYNREANRKVTKVPRKVLDILLAYSWPGNVRELENCIERAVVLSPDNSVSLDLLPEEIRNNRPDSFVHYLPDSAGEPEEEVRQAVIRFLAPRKKMDGAHDRVLEIAEEALLRHLLDSGLYSQRELSKLLGMSRVTLRKKLSQYHLS
jgi:DNA-binding NtrC family response regulator